MDVLPVSERRVCKVLGQSRTTQRYQRKPREDEEVLTERIIELATRFGRYGYRRITALLKAEGWRMNHKRVERIWRREGLRVPSKQPKRGRLWFNDGSHVYAFAQSTGTTSGPMTLSTRGHMMEDS
jgi:putative transposase